MTAVYIVTIVFTAVVVILAIISSTILTGMRLRHSGFKAGDKKAWDEETRLIQQLHQDLTKMETRIEALETILMENFGKDKQ
jgi:phage shock protein B